MNISIMNMENNDTLKEVNIKIVNVLISMI